MTRRWPLLAALLAAASLAALVFSLVQVRSDLGELLPQGGGAAARVMTAALQSGPASGLVLIGLEGAPDARLAAISTAMGNTLRRDPSFRLVSNGQQLLDPAAQADLFAHRYLLSPATTAAAFETPALRQDFQALLDGLSSSASPVIQQYGLPDPTGAFRTLAAQWIGGSDVRLQNGVWFARDRGRALMLAQLRTAGLDLGAEDRALAAIGAAFHAAQDSTQGGASARLLVSGPAVFAHDAAHAVQADVRLLSVASSLLVAGLLFWRFRSLWVVIVIAVPLLTAAAAGALAVQLGFGFVHGITIGFGMTMLGVAVDYPVLLIGHRKVGEPVSGTLRRIGAAYDLAVSTAALGLTGMAFSGFPGLSQLGVFSVAGLLAAAGVTRLLLPRLIVLAGLAPVSAGDPGLLARIEPWRRWRLLALAPVGLAAVLLAVRGGPAWDADLGDLSPVPARALALDAALRRELGAPETGQVLVVEAGSAEAVLQQEEALLPKLDGLVRDGAAGGVELAARLLPSVRTQRARQAALPDAQALSARVAQAASGLGFSGTAFTPFEDGVAAARQMQPVRLADLPAGALSARLGALLFAHQGRWFGVIAPSGVRDPHRFAAAFPPRPDAGQDSVTYVDVHEETNRVAAGYTRQAWPWLAGGAGAAVLALTAGLRNGVRLGRVLGSIASALLVTVAVLTLAGARLSVIHLVALQFVAGIGLDYALFFSRTGLDDEERSRTLRTLFTCNGMALLTFGLLCVCHTPLLRQIGVTVGAGVVSAMAFAFFFAGPRQMPVPAKQGASV